MIRLQSTNWLVLLVIENFFYFLITESYRCGENEYLVVNSTTAIRCMKCPTCPIGTEAFPACGSSVSYVDVAGLKMECQKCKKGYVRDSMDDKPSCYPCSTCSNNQVYMEKCTATTDSVCGTCLEGFVTSSDLIDCLPCCHCVGDDEDVKDARCPASKPCLPHEVIRTCRNHTNAVSNSWEPVQLGKVGSSITNSLKANSHWSNKLFVISVGMSGFLLLFTLLAVIRLLRQRRKEAYNNSRFLGALYLSESRSSLVPFTSTSSYTGIDVPKVVNCPIKLCRARFEDQLLCDVPLDWSSMAEVTTEEAKRLYRSLLNIEPPKKDMSWKDIIKKLELSDPDFKVSTFVFYIQEIDRNDVLKALHVSLHQDVETVPLTVHVSA